MIEIKLTGGPDKPQPGGSALAIDGRSHDAATLLNKALEAAERGTELEHEIRKWLLAGLQEYMEGTPLEQALGLGAPGQQLARNTLWMRVRNRAVLDIYELYSRNHAASEAQQLTWKAIDRAQRSRSSAIQDDAIRELAQIGAEAAQQCGSPIGEAGYIRRLVQLIREKRRS